MGWLTGDLMPPFDARCTSSCLTSWYGRSKAFWRRCLLADYTEPMPNHSQTLDSTDRNNVHDILTPQGPGTNCLYPTGTEHIDQSTNQSSEPLSSMNRSRYSTPVTREQGLEEPLDKVDSEGRYTSIVSSRSSPPPPLIHTLRELTQVEQDTAEDALVDCLAGFDLAGLEQLARFYHIVVYSVGRSTSRNSIGQATGLP